MGKITYSMSFTTGTLLYRESMTVAHLYQTLGNWDDVRDQVIAENRLQMRTLNSSKRIVREINSRLKLLTPLELAILHEDLRQEQIYLLWLAVCKRYQFIYDFAVEVIREKFLCFDFTLLPVEFDAFFNAKAEWHPEVERVAPATRNKLRQFVFKMLREADLIDANQRILPALLTPRLIDAIRQDAPAHFAIFPVSDRDMQEWAV